MTGLRLTSVGLVCAAVVASGCGDGNSETSDSETMASSGLATVGTTTAGPETDTQSDTDTDSSGGETAGETLDTSETSDSETTDTTMDPTTMDPTTMDPTTMDPTTMDPTTMDPTTMDPTDPTDPTSDSDSDTGEPECGNLQVTYRDFMPLHEDFGCHMSGNFGRPGLVLQTLGNDNKPQYNPNPPPPPPGYNGSDPQITNASTFSQWYNTVDGVNLEIQGELELTEIMPGVYSFASDAFYPLTDMGFGNNVDPNWAGQTYPDRNGAFTSEIHTSFIYQPGQEFTFIGDDDVWVFIDGQLALDLGGLHPPDQDTIVLDSLGLNPGQSYTLDAFHAERCGSGSNFRIDTSINCFIPE